MADEVVEIARLNAETIRVPIISTAPLLMHRFSEKARKEMLARAQGERAPKEPKDPEAEYHDAFYWLNDDTYGFPAIAFKSATVGAARYYDKSVPMTLLRQTLFFRGEPGKSDPQQMYPIIGEPRMREDVVRVGAGKADLRYRPEFPEWSTMLTVVYVRSLLTRDSVLSLIDAGGLGVGVGDWRPEKGGDNGTFRVDETKEIEVLS